MRTKGQISVDSSWVNWNSPDRGAVTFALTWQTDTRPFQTCACVWVDVGRVAVLQYFTWLAIARLALVEGWLWSCSAVCDPSYYHEQINNGWYMVKSLILCWIYNPETKCYGGLSCSISIKLFNVLGGLTITQCKRCTPAGKLIAWRA